MLTKVQLILASVNVSIILSIIIVFVSWLIFKKSNKRFSFLDLAKDSDGWPSLALFQFLLWTLVIIFCFTTVSLIRYFGGVLDIPGNIPKNLLILMGLSVTVTPISTYISIKKYGEPGKPGGWESMLLENKQPSLSRFQMFSWTILSIILYVLLFFSTLKELDITKLQDLFLPDIDSTLVMLMGLSQGAYVAGKFMSPPRISITGIYPEKVNKGKTATITGTNFGTDRGSIIIGKEIISKDNIKEWDENRIEFIVPEVKGKYDIAVLVGTKEIKMVDTNGVKKKIEIE